MHIQTDRALTPSNTPCVRYLHVVIAAPPAPTADGAPPRRPVDTALVLDRSGSMAGRKFDMARTAVSHAIQLLKPQDHFAVVCYDDEVTTVMDRTNGTHAAKTLAMKQLRAIEPRGATDLHGGWIRGAALTRNPVAAEIGGDALSKVLLLTDGLANHGVIDHDALVAEATRLRAEGVPTSTFGVGADFDEDLLSRLATAGGGHFYFIERAEQIPDFFASELGETLEVVARDAVFEVACDPGVDAAVLNGLPAEHVEGRLRVPLGNLVADQELTLIVAVAFKGATPEGTGLGVECRVSDRDHALVREPLAVTWQAVDVAANEHQPVNREVRLAVATLLAERARAAALAANRRSDYDEARRILREIVNDLRAMAPGDRHVVALIDQLHHDELALSEEMSPMEMKARHFASYGVARSRDPEGRARRTTRRPQ